VINAKHDERDIFNVQIVQAVPHGTACLALGENGRAFFNYLGFHLANHITRLCA
jgi:hypothetical protein